jgi:hypothetical protein
MLAPELTYTLRETCAISGACVQHLAVQTVLGLTEWGGVQLNIAVLNKDARVRTADDE